MAKIKGKDSIKAKYKSLSKAGKTRRLSPDEKKEKRRLRGLLRGKPFGKVLLSYDKLFQKRSYRKQGNYKDKSRRVVLVGGDGKNTIMVAPVYNQAIYYRFRSSMGNALSTLTKFGQSAQGMRLKVD